MRAARLSGQAKVRSPPPNSPPQMSLNRNQPLLVGICSSPRFSAAALQA